MKGKVEKTRFWFIEGVSFTSEELARSREEAIEIDDRLMSNQLVERLEIARRSRLVRFNCEPIKKEEEAHVTVQETTLDLGDGDTRHVVCVELDGGTLDGFGWMLLLPRPERVRADFCKLLAKYGRKIVKQFSMCLAEQMIDGDVTVAPIRQLMNFLTPNVGGLNTKEEVALQYKCFIEHLETISNGYSGAKRVHVGILHVKAPDGSSLLDKSYPLDEIEMPKFEDLMKDKLIKWQMEHDLTQDLK